MNQTYQINAILRERQFTFTTVGGLSLPKTEIEVGVKLLVETAEIEEDAQILDINCGYGAVGIVAAADAPLGNATLMTCDIKAMRLAQQNIRRNRLVNAKVILVDKPQDALNNSDTPIFDVVLMWNVPHLGKDFCFEMIQKSKPCLKEGGEFYIAAKTKKGAKSIASFMRRIYGNVETLKKSKGYRILHSVKEHDSGEDVAENYKYQITEELRGKQYTFLTRPGVFSRKKIDVGTRLLAESIEINESDTIFDLGCGYGVVGIATAHLAKRGMVYLADTNIRAIRCARYNIAQNGCKNAQAQVSDGFEAVNDIDFDLILSNPPTHSGKEVILPFMRSSYERLKPNGRFAIVVVKPEIYLRELRRIFGDASILLQKDRHTIIMSVKR